MRSDEAETRDPRAADELRAKLRALPPGLLYELAAARCADGTDWRARGAALLLEAAADDQVGARG